MKEDQIIADYQRKRRELEADEEMLKEVQRQGEQLIQSTLADIYRIIQPSAVTNEPFDQARQAITQVETEYFDQLMKAKKQVDQQLTELEQDYRKALQRNDQESE